MTATNRRALTAPTAPTAGHPGVTQRHVLAAEAIKFRSVRSSLWLVIASALGIAVPGVLPALALVLSGGDPATGDQPEVDPTGGVLSGISPSQLLIAAVGVLIVTGEYSSGLVRATFTAVPARLPVLWAKAAIALGVSFLVTVLAVFVAFFGVRAMLASADVDLSLAAPGVLRALIGSGVYMAVTAVLGVAFGVLLRNAIGAMAALFGLLFVTPLLGLLVEQVNPYLPANAGAAIMQLGSGGAGLPPWAGLAVFVLYALAALAAAAVVLLRRDS